MKMSVTIKFDAFRDDTDRKMQLKNLCQVLLTNRRYMDPKGVDPPTRVGIVLCPRIAPDARVTKLATTHPSKMQKENMPPVAATPSEMPSSADTPLPTTRNGLIKEHFLIQHCVLVLQRRDATIRAALKKLEEDEVQTLKRKVAQLEEETMASREQLREKDRKIRRLEGGDFGF